MTTRLRLFKSARVAGIMFCAFILVASLLIGAGIHAQPVLFIMIGLLLASIVLMQLTRPKRI